ncbi:MAG: FAD/NAD(P)-binding oxidoreductase, partial [Clostridia bacterium]|nr:FAD/NAD(P)-binding oxidoreductase [Clostridia bacterium]
VGERSTTREGLEEWLIPRCTRLIPSLPQQLSIKPFAGYLPKGGADYILKPSPVHPRFINIVLGSSGFTSSVAAAEYVVNEVLPAAGLALQPKADFDPLRQDIPHMYDLSDEERAELIAKDPLYGHIICRCETVSEGEVVEAIRRGARTRDGVKFRTRSGMGRCQGGFCGPRVLRILSRELGVPEEQITRKGKGSAEVLFKTKQLLKEGQGTE